MSSKKPNKITSFFKPVNTVSSKENDFVEEVDNKTEVKYNILIIFKI